MFLAALAVIALSVGSVHAIQTTEDDALARANDRDTHVQIVETDQGSSFLDQDLAL